MSRNAHFYGLIRRFASRSPGLVFCLLLTSALTSPRLLVASPPARARVVIVQDPAATVAFRPQPEAVHALVQRGLTNYTGQREAGAAWLSLVSTQDVIGIKIFASPGPQVGTRIAVVEGIIEGLLAAKIPARQIIIWDRQLYDLRRAGFAEVARRYGVRLAGAQDSGWDENTFYDTSLIGQLVYGDLEFQKKGEGVGRKSYVSKLVSKEITKIINVSPLLNHNSTGVCGNLYSLALGSVDNTIRFEGDPARLAQAVPEIYALPVLGDRVVLNIVDALICQYQGEEIGRLHDSAELNELRFSTDPVALDILSVQEIARQRGQSFTTARQRSNRIDLYQNAALLELGSADLGRIDVQTLPPPAR